MHYWLLVFYKTELQEISIEENNDWGMTFLHTLNPGQVA